MLRMGTININALAETIIGLYKTEVIRKRGSLRRLVLTLTNSGKYKVYLWPLIDDLAVQDCFQDFSFTDFI